MASPASAGPVIDQTTVLSLLLTVLLLLLAYFLSLRLLPSASSPRTRILFIWHAFDSLIHTLLEGSFLYHCFSTYTAITRPEMLSALVDSASGGKAPARDPPLVTAPGVHFLGREGRLYGPGYIDGSGQGGGLMAPMARLWMEYAKADRRWGGADLGVVSLECLTVFIGAPLAAYVCYLLAKEGDVGSKRRLGGRASFWMTVLATMELYGGEHGFSLFLLFFFASG